MNEEKIDFSQELSERMNALESGVYGIIRRQEQLNERFNELLKELALAANKITSNE